MSDLVFLTDFMPKFNVLSLKLKLFEKKSRFARLYVEDRHEEAINFRD
jgi:hypothetical protein